LGLNEFFEPSNSKKGRKLYLVYKNWVEAVATCLIIANVEVSSPTAACNKEEMVKIFPIRSRFECFTLSKGCRLAHQEECMSATNALA
jgi:hypothetical protein